MPGSFGLRGRQRVRFIAVLQFRLLATSVPTHFTLPVRQGHEPANGTREPVEMLNKTVITVGIDRRP